MNPITIQHALAFLAGLGITLFLAAYLTPRQWWRRPNVRALLVAVAGSWACGTLILHFVPDHMAAVAESQPAAAPDAKAEAEANLARALIAGQSFQVHRDLNLRAAAGVATARLVTVPAGATVTPTGARDGDWWQVKARVAGRDTEGWVSSLWLRRSGE
jgi:hypothetical protein